MKTRTITIASIAALLLTAGTTGALAATSQDKKASEDQAKINCYRTHAKLMSKPAVMTPADCWRMHGYLMRR